MIQRNTFLVSDENSRDSPGREPAVAGSDPIRIWLVDDNNDFRGLLAEFLQAEADFECKRQFPSPTAVLDALARETAPDVILLDIEMGEQNGLDAVRPIKSLAGSTRVLMLTTFFDSHSRTRALRDGASDFLLKRDPVGEIVKRIRQAQAEPAITGFAAGSNFEESAELESAGSSGRISPSSWPNRRASEWENGRWGNDDVKQPNPDAGRRNALWRCLSSWLMRGVGFLRGLPGPGEYHENLAEPQSSAAPGH